MVYPNRLFAYTYSAVPEVVTDETVDGVIWVTSQSACGQLFMRRPEGVADYTATTFGASNTLAYEQESFNLALSVPALLNTMIRRKKASIWRITSRSTRH